MNKEFESFVNPIMKGPEAKNLDNTNLKKEALLRKPDEEMKREVVTVVTADGSLAKETQDRFKEAFLIYEINQLKREIEKLKEQIEEKNDPDVLKNVKLQEACEKHIKQIEDWIAYYENQLGEDGEHARKLLEEAKELFKKAQTYYI